MSKGRKVTFRNNDSAHDFADKIGSRVDIDANCKSPNQQTYSVDTSIASYGKDDPYGEKASSPYDED